MLIDERAKARFLSKVRKTKGCWYWRAFCNKEGYGYFRLRGIVERAHRVAYWIFIGDLPEDKSMVDHLCRNTGCVNPKHLEAVTNQENVKRGVAARLRYCPKGHEYNSPNLLSYSYGRRCRICLREKGLAWYYENREAYNLKRRKAA